MSDEHALKKPGFKGVMCYALPEALWLYAAGTSDDLLVAYPTVDKSALQALVEDDAARRHITIMVDSPAHLDVIGRVLGGGHPEIRVWVCLDTTTHDASVTELAAGSGLIGPALFDAYRRFAPRPSLLYALPVVRRPETNIATLFSGGYLASGTGTRDRLPQPYLPRGLRLTGTEGAGEVQTPVRGAAANDLQPGDRVWMRHAKAGELAERFDQYHVIHDDQVTAVPTYRGEGQCFG